MFSFLNKNKVKSIEVNQLDSNLVKIKLIDIREPMETRSGTIKGAKKVPMNNLLANPQQYLKMDEEYYIMCQSGMRSSRTTKALSKQGYNVVNVIGGYGAYRGKNTSR